VRPQAYGSPAGYFDAYTDHSLNVLRMNNYALPEGERVELDGDLVNNTYDTEREAKRVLTSR
jgi:hypothetical protein